MSDKEKSLIEELNDLPSTLKPIGETPETTESAEPRELIDPMAKPLWEIDEDFVNPFEELPPIQTWAVMGDRPAIPKLGVVCFSAKEKQGKSLSVYALSLALLSGKQFDTFKAREEPRLIMIFDLEMSKITLVNRIRAMAETLGAKANKFVVCSLLAKVGDIEEAKATIMRKVNLYQPDIVVIDQVAQLCNDINNSAEGKALRAWLEGNSLGRDRSVWVVIHENKTDTNEAGHLGGNVKKAFVEGYKVSKQNGVFTITPSEDREHEICGAASVRFAIQNDGKIITATDIFNEQQEKDREKLFREFADIFGSDMELRRSEMEKRIVEKRGVGKTQANNYIDTAVQSKVVEKVSEGNRFSPYRLVRPENDFEDMEDIEEDDI